MKKIILLLSLSVVIASMFELAGAKDKATQTKETAKDRSSVTTPTPWCPIVGTARAAEQGSPVLKDENGVETQCSNLSRSKTGLCHFHACMYRNRVLDITWDRNYTKKPFVAVENTCHYTNFCSVVCIFCSFCSFFLWKWLGLNFITKILAGLLFKGIKM
jgi:hypothetical protein